MYGITQYWQDWAMVGIMAFAILVMVVVVRRRHYRGWKHAMKRAMEDYSYSSYLVREMDKRH